MLLWFLLVVAFVLSVLRFPATRRHLGRKGAIAILVFRWSALVAIALLASPLTFSYQRPLAQPARIAILVDASQSVEPKARQKALRQLRKALSTFQGSVTVWEFADDLRPMSLEKLSSPMGQGSRLSDAVRRIAETVRPDELLLITDAQDTLPLADTELLAALQRAKTRLNALLLPPRLPPNLSLSLSPVQSFLFAGEEAKITVKVQGERIPDGTSGTVRVWEGRRQVARAQVRVVKGRAQAQFSLRPDRAGWHRFRVEVLPTAGERWTEDNAAEVALWRAPTKLRVLLATGAPSFEFKFVKQTLASEPNFEWVAIASLPDGTRYQQGTPSLLPASLHQLTPFHVALVLSPTPADFGATEGRSLWQFVQQGGGLLLGLSEPCVRASGWRLILPLPLSVTALSPSAPLTIPRHDVLGEQLPEVLPTDARWAVEVYQRPVQVALESGGKPVLVWWQEGLGRVAVLGMDGTWRWAMEAARKGEPPKQHRQFWRTLIRFLADPMKGTRDKGQGTGEMVLAAPKPPPMEWSTAPQPERVRAWVVATGGKLVTLDDLSKWLQRANQKRTITVSTHRPLSASPFPYLLLLLALTAEWWLIRRSGLP